MSTMDPQASSVTGDLSSGDETSRPLITAHESAPDRLVLSEDGNTDGWIATDLTVDVENYH